MPARTGFAWYTVEMSKDRFRRKLAEQIGFLQTSAQCFDMGSEAEAIRLAMTLRVLFHSNPNSKNVSVLKHLKMDGADVLSTAALGPAQHLAFVNIRLDLAARDRIKAVPRLGNQFFPMPANEWWAGQVVYEFKGQPFTRADVIRAAANQDGGAHVAVALQAFYEDMEEGAQGMSLNGQNLRYSYTRAEPKAGEPKTENCKGMHYAMLRQFTHEVLATAGHYKWLQTP